ncbi:MAG: CBS domain-containing protein, partial [Gammaproteobacteria bacterium]|nr:CBS domain-containing protein [Gammaproteobacteria bacterium]
MRNRPINRIMTAPAVVAHPETTQQEACELMAKHHVHHLPVLEGGRLVGIVSAVDLVCRPKGVRSGVAASQIAEVMHRDPVVLSHDSTLHDAAVLLASGGYHSLPVTDSAGTVLGIVTSSDLIGVLVRQLPASGEAGASERGLLPGIAAEFADTATLTAAVSAAEQRWQPGGNTDQVAGALLYLASKSHDLENV